MTQPFRYAGTVSHGTMQEQDLISAFFPVLSDLAPEASARLAPDSVLVMAALHMGEPSLIDVGEFMAELFDAMDSAAPDGYRFGAHEGDGSDYGYWEVEVEDCIEDNGDDTCKGPVLFRESLSGTGTPIARCDHHWSKRLDLQQELAQRYPRHAPADFDPSYAGERWDEDY